MKTLRLAASVAVATLACTAGAVLAQDEGKTEAAKLTSESPAALEMLTSSVASWTRAWGRARRPTPAKTSDAAAPAHVIWFSEAR
jgi:hypothetical protein